MTTLGSLAFGLMLGVLAPPPAASILEPDPQLEPPPEPQIEPPAPQLDMAQIDAAFARLPPQPSLRAVQDAALQRAGVGPHAGARWLRQARVAAALPTISVQYDHRLDQGWALDREVGEADALRNDAGNQSVIRAKATWELDRLIFSPDELRAARAALDLADFRERVLVQVTQLYYERQRLLVEREIAPPSDLQAAIAASVRLREVEGLLAGLTGLDFGPTPTQ
ncbi:hypothetical protein [Enhygromyxa salina]|nr:hypothetical protein [Enhygromyxa salina]